MDSVVLARAASTALRYASSKARSSTPSPVPAGAKKTSFRNEADTGSGVWLKEENTIMEAVANNVDFLGSGDVAAATQQSHMSTDDVGCHALRCAARRYPQSVFKALTLAALVVAMLLSLSHKCMEEAAKQAFLTREVEENMTVYDWLVLRKSAPRDQLPGTSKAMASQTMAPQLPYMSVGNISAARLQQYLLQQRALGATGSLQIPGMLPARGLQKFGRSQVHRDASQELPHMQVYVAVGQPLWSTVMIEVPRGGRLKQCLLQGLSRAGWQDATLTHHVVSIELDGKVVQDSDVAEAAHDLATFRVRWRGCLGGGKNAAQRKQESRAKADANTASRAAAGSASLASMFQRPSASGNEAGSSSSQGPANAQQAAAPHSSSTDIGASGSMKHQAETKSRAAEKKQYYQDNKVHILAAKKEHYEDNQEAIREYKKQHYEDNQEAIRGDRKQHYEDNQEAIREYKKQHHEDNQEAIREYKKQHYEDNEEAIRGDRKQHYEDNREAVLAARTEHYQFNKEQLQESRKERYQQKQAELKATMATADERRKLEIAKTWRHAEKWSNGMKLPPCFASLQDPESYEWLEDMHRFFEDCTVETCSLCKERWFAPPASETSFGWSTAKSKILAAPAGGPQFLTESDGQTICQTCKDPATSQILTARNNMDLGGPVPPALAALTDFEEMLVSRVHPLVQVFTLFPSGQLGYVGHIVNYRQDSVEWVQALPLTPADVPVVLVKRQTRESKSVQRKRAPFSARKSVLRDATSWLLENHPQWQAHVHGGAHLSEENLAHYRDDDEPIDLPTHEVSMPDIVDVGRELFAAWVMNPSFKFAGVTRNFLDGLGELNGNSLWDAFRQQLAEATGAGRWRAAQTIPSGMLAAWLADNSKLSAREASAPEPSEDEQVLVAEFVAEMENKGASEPVEGAGVVEDNNCDGDEHYRRAAAEGLAAGLGHADREPDAEAGPSAQDGGVPSSGQPQSRAPRLDPPRKGQPVREDEPGLVSAAFPTIFPYGQGDFNQPRPFKVSFETWVRHVMLWGDHRAMTHKRFRYWALNTMLRVKAAQMRTVFYRQNPGDKDLTPEMLSTKEARQALVKKMVTVTQGIPGSMGERWAMRADLERMVQQVDYESQLATGEPHQPSLFETFTCAVYKWAGLHDMIEKLLPQDVVRNRKPLQELTEEEKRQRFFRDAVDHPGVVSWYCAIKLEQQVHLAIADINRQLREYSFDPEEWRPSQLDEDDKEGDWGASPAGARASTNQAKPQADEAKPLPPVVDDWYASYEWGSGGIVHLHVVLWIKGAPRVDVAVKLGSGGDMPLMEPPDESKTIVLEEDVATIMASFFDRLYTEWNARKAPDGSEAERLGERERAKRAGTEKQTRDPCSTSWEELRGIFGSSADPNSPEQSAARLDFCAKLAEWCQMHDWHLPHANGPPLPKQSCARCVAGTEGTDAEVAYCGKLFPRPLRKAGEEAVAEDPHRKKLHRVWLSRNCHFINNFSPLQQVALMANMDCQAVCSKYAVVEYITKYMTKAGKGTIISQAEQAFDDILAGAIADNKGVGSALARFFNTQVAPKAISQLEVHHILWGFPPYLASRAFTRMSLRTELKKLKTPEEMAWDPEDKTLTKLSALGKYEDRGAELPPKSPHPITGYVFSSTGEWQDWMKLASWWDWKQLVYVTNRQGKTYAHFNAKPKIVHVSPWLRFGELADPKHHGQSCRYALIGYMAFPNGHPQATSADQLRSLSDEDAAGLLEDWLFADSDKRRQLAWNRPPGFVKEQWEHAKKAEAKTLKSAQRKAGKETRKATAEQQATAAGVQQAQQTEANLRQDQAAEPGSSETSKYQKSCRAMQAKDRTALAKKWEKHEAEEEAEFKLWGSELQVLRGATHQWLRKTGWGSQELHDACVGLGQALPRRCSKMNYLAKIRVACTDPVTMKLPGGSFPGHALKSALASLKLGVSGKKAQLVERLCNAIAAEDGSNMAAADQQEAQPEDGSENLNMEADFGKSSKVREYAARVEAAWQEHSSHGAQVLEDPFDGLVDALEDDVRAEQEALLQLAAGVNPEGLDLASLDPVKLRHIGKEEAKEVLEADAPAAAEAHSKNLRGGLDPTQGAFHDHVLEWAMATASGQPLPLRAILLGTAGTGKSDTVRATIQSVERVLGAGSVLRCAHTGVAAFNMGQGAETIHSIFKLSSDLGNSATEDALVQALTPTKLLIIDEISMVGSEQFFAVSDRLELVARTLWRRRNSHLPRMPSGKLEGEPTTFGGFGGIGVVVVGDFAQIPPIGDASLIAPAKGQSQRAAAGQRLFQSFKDVIRLRRVYRQKGASHYKESTLRLRDAAMSLQDHKLWSEHDLSHAALEADVRTIAEQEALWLVTENKKAGERNGAKMVQLAQANAVAVVKFQAESNRPGADTRPAEDFYQLRSQVHFAIGAPVMLIANMIWDTRTVQAGLMNGARGTVIAIVTTRPMPSLPDYVIVDFPDYKGAAFWHDHPTWVPVPPIARQSKSAPQFERTQLPLRLAWALTVHKAQGLTCPEGIVADLSSSAASRVPAASPGLAFVALTRVTSWAKMAFRSLPGFGDFLAARNSKLFAAREKAEHRFDAAHAETMLRWSGWDLPAEIDQHLKYSRQCAVAKGEGWTDSDSEDVVAMLQLQGVRPIPADVLEWAKTALGKAAASYADVLAAFKGKKVKVTWGVRPGKAVGPGERPRAGKNIDYDQKLAMMLEMGFEESDAKRALEGGRTVQAAVQELYPAGSPAKDQQEPSKPAKLERADEQYVRRAMDELGQEVEVVDLGVIAGPAPRTNACLWLSFAASLSHLHPDYQIPLEALRIELSEDMLSVRQTPLEALQHRGRREPRQDALGSMADFLRGYACNAMMEDGGVQRWMPWFAHLSGAANAPRGGGASIAHYRNHVRALRSREFADHLNLIQLAEMFEVEIVVIPMTPLGSNVPWAITKTNPTSSQHRILLGNNDMHYVWLQSSSQPAPLPGRSVLWQDHRQLHRLSKQLEDAEQQAETFVTAAANARAIAAPNMQVSSLMTQLAALESATMKLETDIDGVIIDRAEAGSGAAHQIKRDLLSRLEQFFANVNNAFDKHGRSSAAEPQLDSKIFVGGVV